MHKIAMLGTGLIGRFYTMSLQNFRGKDEIKIVCSDKLENAKKFAEEFGIPRSTEDLAASIRDPEIDTVIIGIPNYLHKKAVLLAAEAGKAVLCTKPLGMSGPEALEMLEAVEKAGVFHGYLEDLAYTPKTLKALQAVQKGALGKVLWARSGGGAIIIINHGNVSGKVAPIMTRLIARPLSPSLQIPNALIIWILFGILMWLLLERTAFGKNLFALGVNRLTARLSGVDVTGMNLATYSLAGALAGFGGFLVVGNTGVVFIALGQPFLFPSIAAVAVGGTLLSGGKGSYWGTMAGAIVLTLITSLLTTMQMPDSVRRMVLGATLLILISIYGRQRALRQ